MIKKELIYEGKAKQVYRTNDEDKVIIKYKDDATAFNNQKRDILPGKGMLNNSISSRLFSYLHSKNIKTHFIEKINTLEQLTLKVNIIPLEFICRNIFAGTTAALLGIEEGQKAKFPILEICYKNDALKDPLINDYHAVALGLTNFEELAEMYKVTQAINSILSELFDSIGIILVDFKIEFGKDEKGNIILADEISPDTCRFWDKETLHKMDKDVFRRNLGNLQSAYQQISDRLQSSPLLQNSKPNF